MFVKLHLVMVLTDPFSIFTRGVDRLSSDVCVKEIEFNSNDPEVARKIGCVIIVSLSVANKTENMLNVTSDPDGGMTSKMAVADGMFWTVFATVEFAPFTSIVELNCTVVFSGI